MVSCKTHVHVDDVDGGLGVKMPLRLAGIKAVIRDGAKHTRLPFCVFVSCCETLGRRFGVRSCNSMLQVRLSEEQRRDADFNARQSNAYLRTFSFSVFAMCILVPVSFEVMSQKP